MNAAPETCVVCYTELATGDIAASCRHCAGRTTPPRFPWFVCTDCTDLVPAFGSCCIICAETIQLVSAEVGGTPTAEELAADVATDDDYFCHNHTARATAAAVAEKRTWWLLLWVSLRTLAVLQSLPVLFMCHALIMCASFGWEVARVVETAAVSSLRAARHVFAQ